MPNNTNVTLKLHGLPLDKTTLPRVLQAGVRAVGVVEEDPFLPRGLIRVEQAFDLSATARATGPGSEERAVSTQRGQVVVLEMPDGVTVITSPEKLKEALARIDPNAVDEEGNLVLYGALRERSGAVRSGFGEAIADGLEGLVSRVFTLTIGAAADPIIEAAKRKACEWIGAKVGEKAEEKIADYADLGVTWLGTKALMWAIEKRLDREPGLYRWINGELTERFEPGNTTLQAEAAEGSLLVFIHGTGSNTAGSFAELQTASAAYWKQFEERYGDRIFALEHRTLSESPIDNALQLARALPDGARLHLVTHSRGGLVGDLMCLERFDDQIDGYALDNMALGEADADERARLIAELKKAHAEQREALRELQAVLRKKKFRIERYVRVACPARGTRLASGNFDVFMSGLLSLIGWVPALKGNPLYSAFKRAVLEIAKNRTKPNLVPGIEAMLPESPMARLLAHAQPQAKVELALIAGDIEGGGLLKRLGVLFTDYVFFDNVNNDLVVDTDSMYAGVARPQQAYMLFDQGPDVSHFRYFTNEVTRGAVRDWLTTPSVEMLALFTPLRSVAAEPSREVEAQAEERKLRARGRDPATDVMPVVVFLPGIMGSHLWVNKSDRVWFDFLDLATGGLEKIQWAAANVEAEKLFTQFYGDLCDHLLDTHRVERSAYDWRQPIDVLATALGKRLRQLLDATKQPQRPVRVLAHSMGGLVVRALIHQQPLLWKELMERDGARFVMLGTPNQGSHLMVESLIGKADTMRSLGRLDVVHNLQGVLNIVAEFRGALQLLPKPGFADTGGAQKDDYFKTELWSELKAEMRDVWFGDGIAGVPSQAALDEAQWLWKRDGAAVPGLPPEHKAKVAYVFGCATKTPCGLTKEGEFWKMIGTTEGDGSVTWASGRIEGIGHFFWMPAEHGDLADTEEYFDSIAELIERGTGGNLMTSPPAVRGAEVAVTATYDAGPVPYPTEVEVAGLFGAPRRVRARARPKKVLKVKVRAMDLRGVAQPILVGHYDEDPISGPEAITDRYLVKGELSVRHNLGLYAGRIGTATAVLLARNEQERMRGSFRGAVVAGLGKYDGTLTVAELTEAIRTAGLRYLLHVQDAMNAGGKESGAATEALRLSSLLIGYNSSANLTIADSVGALVRGIVEANRKFAEQTRSALHIESLDVVELYLDTAISSAYAVRRVAQTMNADPRMGILIDAASTLEQGEGFCHRLLDVRAASYWPRLMVTDADRREDECPPECYEIPTERVAEGTEEDTASQRKLPALMRRRTALAQRLRFLYLGQRARAESVLQQRQPGLVETLVAKQIGVRKYQEDFSRSLFQLLIPHDFKEAARQMDRVVLVVDGYTANLPWELMLADDRPLATTVAMVRQLASTRFRTGVNQALGPRAYVVGNPSVEGFGKAFPHPERKEQRDPDALPGAENEAVRVAEVLTSHAFEVERSIGADQRAIDVINRLYKQPYRIVHIAAHGVFEERGADGKARSGVVLSDGLLITAAEIESMETVPELVFLNCCHLGKTDRTPAAFNKLAYSVSRELIEIGVRAVVAAGWAVGDESASYFAEVFYEALLRDNETFGEAVFRARKATWERYSTDITWGAFQAYGDPGWRISPRDGFGGARRGDWKPVAPEELISELENIWLDIRRMDEALSRQEARRKAAMFEKLIEKAEPKWLLRPDVQSCLGKLYGDLGPALYAKAIDHYQQAILLEDKTGRAPIKAIEQLANLEARAGEERDDLSSIERAIARLEQLNVVVHPELESGATTQAAASLAGNVERASLLGSAFKSKAAVHARRLLALAVTKATKEPTEKPTEKRTEKRTEKPAAGGESATDIAAAAAAEGEKFLEALADSAEAYQQAASKLDAKKVEPYPTLNWLFLAALNPLTDEPTKYTALAQRCAAAANMAFASSASFWNAITAADAYLVETLLDGSLGQAGATGQLALEAVKRKYQGSLEGVSRRPKDLDSVVRQILLMALFHEAKSKSVTDDSALRIAQRLRELAESLVPSVDTQVTRVPSQEAVPATGKASSEGAAGAPPPPAPRQPSAKRAKKSPARTRPR